MRETSEIKVKSLQKSLEVLNCFTKKQPLGVTEISEMLGLYKSNVHNILSTYKAMEYLEQDEETGKYRLGNSIFYLCRALGDSLNLTKIAIPYMQEIVKQLGEIVYLAMPHEDEVIYLEALYPTESVRPMRSLMGERNRMYCTSVGKAILSCMSEETIETYASRELKANTEFTITNKGKLITELKQVKKDGYAVDNMELEFGIKCVGVPIFGSNGEVAGGMSISGPSLRFEEERVKELAEVLKMYAKKIERKL